MVLFHQLIISPVSQMHAFPSCSVGRNPVPTQATITIWLEDWCVLISSLQHVLLCGCFKKTEKKKGGKLAQFFRGTQHEEHKWREPLEVTVTEKENESDESRTSTAPASLRWWWWQRGWKGERRDCISSVTLLEFGATGCRSKARRWGLCPHQKLDFWPDFPPKNVKLLSPVCVYHLQSACEVSCPAQGLPAPCPAE